MSDVNREVNRKELAKYLDVSVQSIDNYIKRGLPFRRVRGRGRGGWVNRYDLAACSAWFAEHVGRRDEVDPLGRLTTPVMGGHAAKRKPKGQSATVVPFKATGPPASAGGPPADSFEAQMQQAKLASEREKAATARQKREKEAGTLITREVAEKTVRVRLEGLRAALLAFPRQLRESLPDAPAMLETVATAKIHQMLADLANATLSGQEPVK